MLKLVDSLQSVCEEYKDLIKVFIGCNLLGDRLDQSGSLGGSEKVKDADTDSS